MAVNWKKAEEYVKAGKAKKQAVRYAHNVYDEATHSATSTIKTEVIVLDPADCPDMLYMIPCPKSPHGTDTDPTGEYIVASGKLAATIPVFSFTKFQQAIANKTFDGNYDGIPVIKYEAALHGEVAKPGLGQVAEAIEHRDKSNNTRLPGGRRILDRVEFVPQGTSGRGLWETPTLGK